MDKTAKEIRQNILKISHASGHGHIPTCFSIVELLTSLYTVMKHDPKNPDREDRDIFVLSKGHASLALYSTLAAHGYFSIDDVYSFGNHGSTFGCHADRMKIPGVEASTGSLGHGISLACGMALGAKIKGTGRHVYTIVGDGESNEGTVWESLMVAEHNSLNNLTVILDNNCSQGRCLPLASPAEKFRAFGMHTIEVDGHNTDEIIKALKFRCEKPVAVIAHTVKGFGCRTLVENKYEWHRKSPDDKTLQQLLGELS